MNRLDFLKRLGLGAAAIAAAPSILSAASEVVKTGEGSTGIIETNSSINELREKRKQERLENRNDKIFNNPTAIVFSVTSNYGIGAKPTIIRFPNKNQELDNGSGKGSIVINYDSFGEIKDYLRVKEISVNSSTAFKGMKSFDIVKTRVDGILETCPFFLGHFRSPQDFNPDIITIGKDFILDPFTHIEFEIHPNETVHFCLKN